MEGRARRQLRTYVQEKGGGKFAYRVHAFGNGVLKRRQALGMRVDRRFQHLRVGAHAFGLKVQAFGTSVQKHLVRGLKHLVVDLRSTWSEDSRIGQ
eukprot:3284716-Rhodomonas_salina.2